MWKTVKLGDVCTITNGSTPLRKEKRYWEEGNVPWFTIDDFRVQGKNITYTQQNVTQAAVDDKKVRLVPANSVLLCCTASIGEAAIARVEMATNQQFNALTPKSTALNSDYLYFVATTLTQTLLSVSGSTTINFISMGKLKEISIPLPPLAEQQRIVAKLDNAFAEIDAAIDVAEKYKSDAQLLFKRKLEHHFHLGGDNWHTTTIGDELTLQRGFDITKKEQKEGNVPVISSGGIKSFHNVAMAKAPGVVIGRKGSLGTTYYTEKDYFPHDTTLWIKDFKQNEPKFCFFFFLSLDVKKLDSGAANPALNRNNVHPLKTFWADKEVQKEVCDEFDKISVQTVALTLLQENKIKQLLSLKSAILAQELQSEAA